MPKIIAALHVSLDGFIEGPTWSPLGGLSHLRPLARPCYEETRDDNSITGVIRTRRRGHRTVFRAHPGMVGPGYRATLGGITGRDALDAAEPPCSARARHRVWRGSALRLVPRESNRCTRPRVDADLLRCDRPDWTLGWADDPEADPSDSRGGRESDRPDLCSGARIHVGVAPAFCAADSPCSRIGNRLPDD